MIQLLPVRHRQRHLPLGVVVARVRHDALRASLRRQRRGRADRALFEGRENIFPHLPTRPVAEVEDGLGVGVGGARQAYLDLEPAGPEATEEGLRR